MWNRAKRVVSSVLGLALGCAALAGCGSSGPKLPIATRVCRGDVDALRGMLGEVSMRITSTDPANIECLLSGNGLRLDVNAQAAPRAWTQFDTFVSHMAQAFGPGTVHRSASLPQDLPGLGYSAAWIASQNQLVATNGTQSQGGSYVTVTVAGARHSQASRLRVAKALANATLASAPRGPSPGPPPS
jgi:hypothetical protein